MKFHTRQLTRRYLCIGCGISLVLVFVIHIQVSSLRWESYDDEIERSKYCNQATIRKHYMHDLRPVELFVKDPTRASFTYQLPNTDFCSSIKPHALVFVVSKSINFGSRNAIRRTWGDFTHVNLLAEFAHLQLKLLFLIDIDDSHLLSLNLEQSIYHDLVQVHLPEHYTLSTYRDMAILHWTETHCPHAFLTVKTDDDIFLNLFLLANILTKIIAHSPNGTHINTNCESVGNVNPLATIYGFQIHNAQVVRRSTDPTVDSTRYIITNDEYPCTYYPDYMSGFGYIINRHARVQLLCAFFRHSKSFHMSDVYVTGILAEYLNIHRQNLRVLINDQSDEDCDLFFNWRNALACASSLHYIKQRPSSMTDTYVFERFNTYWKQVYRTRSLYLKQSGSRRTGTFPQY